MTGLEVVEVAAARAWNMEVPDVPFFQDAAQAMFELSNGAGVIADCSYKAPIKHAAPWTFNFWGSGGLLRTTTSGPVQAYRHGEPEQRIEPTRTKDSSYIGELIDEIKGCAAADAILSTAECLASTEKTLGIQRAADTGETQVSL